MLRPIDAYYHLLSLIARPTGLARSHLLYRLCFEHLYRRRRPRVGLFTLDPILGWRNRPSVARVHPSFEFRVTYRTDELGCRVAPTTTQPVRRVLVLGCSWTFGHGVQDNQTYTWHLGAEHAIPVRNLAVLGYGPAHGHLQLSHCGWLERAVDPGSVVLYCWSPDQLIRAWRSEEWIRLNAWVNPDGPSHPVFDIDGSELVFDGMIGVEGAFKDTWLLPGVLERMQWRVMAMLFAAMATMVGKRGGSFWVVLPPVRPREADLNAAATLRQVLADADVPLLDLERQFLGEQAYTRRNDLFYPFDGHPKLGWHRLVASLLANQLTR